MSLIFYISPIILYLSSLFIIFCSFRSSLQNINLDNYRQASCTFSSPEDAAFIMFERTFGLISRTCDVLFFTPNILFIFRNFLRIEE